MVLSVIMLWTVCAPVYATDAEAGIMPCMDNCQNFVMTFGVLDPGVAEFTVDYFGYSSTFTVAKLTVTFEKRVLGMFWRTVDIGTENNEWVAYNADIQGEFYDSIPMDGTGVYRANFKLEVFGHDTIDVIEKTMECQY